MALKIGISKDHFGVTDALALGILRSIDDFAQSQIVGIKNASEAVQCHITLGFSDFADLSQNFFTDKRPNPELTLEKLMGMEGYDLPLSCCGQVFAKFGHKYLEQLYRERYGPELGLGGKTQKHRDFRKIYEYFVEVVDSWHWSLSLEYPMPEKNTLLVSLGDLKQQMTTEWTKERQTNFHSFVLMSLKAAGDMFKDTCNWYMNSYVPAFDVIVRSLKAEQDFDVVFFDYHFKHVTLSDLLLRAANNLRLPRLIIRPAINASKFRLENVRLVKPILYFPHDWIGRGDHVLNHLGIAQIDFISTERSFAMAQTLAAAYQLAYRLLAHAEEQSNLVVSQECSREVGKSKSRLIRSLPNSRDASTNRNNLDNGEEQRQQQPPRPKDSKDQQQKQMAEELAAKLQMLETKSEEEDNNGQNGQMGSSPTNGMMNTEEENIGPENDGPSTTTNGTNNNREEEEGGSAPSADEQQPQQQLEEAVVVDENLQNNIKLGSPDSYCPHRQMSSSSSSPLLNGFTLPEEEDPAEVVERDVAKLVRLDNAVMGVPTQFQLCHIVAAAFIGLAMGTDQQNLKLKGLESPECTIKLGSGIYDFKDPHRAFSSAQTVSLFSLDLAPRSFNTRLSVAGISFAFYGKRAVAKMAMGGGGSNPDQIRQFLRNADAKKRLAAIFRRVYRRLVQPIDEFSSDAHQHRPMRTRESDLLHSTLANLLAVSNVSSEESLDCFHVTLHVCMQFIDRLVRSLVDE